MKLNINQNKNLLYVTSHDDASATTDSDFTLSLYQLIATTSSIQSSNELNFFVIDLTARKNVKLEELTIKNMFCNKIKDHSL